MLWTDTIVALLPAGTAFRDSGVPHGTGCGGGAVGGAIACGGGAQSAPAAAPGQSTENVMICCGRRPEATEVPPLAVASEAVLNVPLKAPLLGSVE